MRTVRIAARRLARTPGFTATAVLVLGLAIGVNASVFSVARGVVLRPLPWPDAERLAIVAETHPEAGLDRLATSYPNLEDWRREAGVFDALVGYHDLGTLVLTGADASPLRLRVNTVESRYLELLGARPALGRLLLPGEDDGWDAHPVAVLSHALWRHRFEADPGVIGRAVTLSDRSYTVVGVLAAGFDDLGAADHATDVWVPLSMAGHVLGHEPGPGARGFRWLVALGRLRPGTSPERAQAALDTLAASMARRYPETGRGHGIRLRPLDEVQRGDVRGAIAPLVVAALFVLLTGVANVSSLLLARALERRHAFAVQAALGMSRGALVREALAEGLLLSGAGGAVGILLGYGLNARLPALLPVPLPPWAELSLDRGALAVAVVLALAAGGVFALVPAVQARRRDLRDALDAAGRAVGAGGASGRLSRLIVAVEVAAAAALLVGGLEMTRSFAALHATGLGFRADSLLTLKMDLEARRFRGSDDLRRFGERLLDAVAALPGVEAATLWGPRTPGEATWYTAVYARERPAALLSDAAIARRHHVGPGALTALGIPLIAGRDFEAGDRAGRAPVAVVSASLADALWPGESALGRRLLRWNPVDPNEAEPFEVVGVAADVRHAGRRRPPDNPRDVYFAWQQVPRREMVALVRGTGDAAALAPRVRRAVAAIDPALPLYDVATLRERMARDEQPTRFAALLMGLYAGLAAGLAVLGVYAVVSGSVRRRTRELGVRQALGARHRHLLGLVVRQSAGLVALGLGPGLLAGAALVRASRSIVWGIQPGDPWAFVAVGLVLGATGAAAGLPAAWRAVRLSPLRALREGGH